MKRPIRFGILSFAHYHANFWAEAINEHADAVLPGIWDDAPERGKDAATRFACDFEPDLGALLDRCDAVGITSETALHAKLVVAAAAAGVHILCEKPIATSLADTHRIEQAVRSSGVHFMQNLPKRFDPINVELVEIVQSGTLGQTTLLRIRHGHHHGLDPDFTARWYADPMLSGGGTLIDEGVHATDFAHWLLGNPESVVAEMSSSALGLDVEDTGIATFVFQNGTLAEITTSWTFTAAEQSIEVFGTEGTAVLRGVDLASRPSSCPPYLDVYSHETGSWSGSPTIPAFLTSDFHQRGPRRFIDDLLADRSPDIGLAEGRASLEMILAAYRSIATGRKQFLPLE